jgi:hypothetical protein
MSDAIYPAEYYAKKAAEEALAKKTAESQAARDDANARHRDAIFAKYDLQNREYEAKNQLELRKRQWEIDDIDRTLQEKRMSDDISHRNSSELESLKFGFQKAIVALNSRTQSSLQYAQHTHETKLRESDYAHASDIERVKIVGRLSEISADTNSFLIRQDIEYNRRKREAFDTFLLSIKQAELSNTQDQAGMRRAVTEYFLKAMIDNKINENGKEKEHDRAKELMALKFDLENYVRQANVNEKAELSIIVDSVIENFKNW